jgi:hypothetical protein
MLVMPRAGEEFIVLPVRYPHPPLTQLFPFLFFQTRSHDRDSDKRSQRLHARLQLTTITGRIRESDGFSLTYSHDAYKTSDASAFILTTPPTFICSCSSTYALLSLS